MQTEDLIPADECCSHYQVEISFLDALGQSGLIKIVTVSERRFIPATQLADLEKIIRLHYDLDINLEGVEAITHLLRRVQDMQRRLTTLTNQLKLYESHEQE
jgi:hypothetical protein